MGRDHGTSTDGSAGSLREGEPRRRFEIRDLGEVMNYYPCRFLRIRRYRRRTREQERTQTFCKLTGGACKVTLMLQCPEFDPLDLSKDVSEL